MKLHPGPLIPLCVLASVISERDVVYRKVEQLLLREENASIDDGPSMCSDYILSCRLDIARSIANDTWKNGRELMLGGHRFGFGYLLSRYRNARRELPTLPSCLTYMIVCFPCLTSLSLLNVSEATRQLYYAVMRLISIT